MYLHKVLDNELWSHLEITIQEETILEGMIEITKIIHQKKLINSFNGNENFIRKSIKK